MAEEPEPRRRSCDVICKAVDEKIEAIYDCVKSKVTNKMFYTLIGGLAFFSVVLQGGMLWSLKDTLATLAADVKVMSEKMTNNAEVTKELKEQIRRFHP